MALMQPVRVVPVVDRALYLPEQYREAWAIKAAIRPLKGLMAEPIQRASVVEAAAGEVDRAAAAQDQAVSIPAEMAVMAFQTRLPGQPLHEAAGVVVITAQV